MVTLEPYINICKGLLTRLIDKRLKRGLLVSLNRTRPSKSDLWQIKIAQPIMMSQPRMWTRQSLKKKKVLFTERGKLLSMRLKEITFQLSEEVEYLEVILDKKLIQYKHMYRGKDEKKPRSRRTFSLARGL